MRGAGYVLRGAGYALRGAYELRVTECGIRGTRCELRGANFGFDNTERSEFRKSSIFIIHSHPAFPTSAFKLPSSITSVIYY